MDTARQARISARRGRALSAPADTPATPPARVSASTIRRMRTFHYLTHRDLAAMFRVSERTVFRWEKRGVDPDGLEPDPHAHPASGPDWRRKLLIFMLDRLNGAGVSDNRKQEGAA